MLKSKIEYINFNELLHKQFPRILNCKIYEKNDIINFDITCSNIVLDISDDISYDSLGKYITISIGQWHNIESGKYISLEDFVDLEEYDVYNYEYVEVVIKVYTDQNYKVYFHNYMDRRIKVSLIPEKLVSFGCNDCHKKIFEF